LNNDLTVGTTMEKKEVPWNREMMVLRIRARYQMSSTPYAKWYQNNHADYLAINFE